MNEVPTEQAHLLDKRRVRRNFDCAASRYDQYAVLQQEISRRLVERFDYIRLSPQRILDVGCGTGDLSGRLMKRYPQAQVVGMDFSLQMARVFRRKIPWTRKLRKNVYTVCADAEQLVFAGQRFDLVVSSLTLQWCNHIDRVFAEVKRVLRPGGLFMFTTFGPDSLKELRSCWSKVDDATHVSAFYDMHDLGDALARSGFADPVMDVEHLVMTYPDLKKLVTDLRMIGATNATRGRRRGLTGKNKWRELQHCYEVYRRQGLLPASYEVVFGHAWCA